MLKLINITKNDNYIEAEYTPENAKEKGFIRIALNGNILRQHRIINV